MTELLFNRVYNMTAWRETIPAPGAVFDPKRISAANPFQASDVRIRFKIERAHTKTPNQCDIDIYNLSAETRADLETLPLTVQLEGGYDGAPRLMFTGEVHFAMSELKGRDMVTLLQMGEGTRAYAYSRHNKSYASGTTYRTVLRDAAQTMGLDLPKYLEKVDHIILDTQFAGGTVATGPSREVLTRLLAPLGYNWSVQADKLEILRDEDVSSSQLIAVDQEHGMIGSPQFGSPPRSGKPPHMNVKMLLYPEIRPGALIQLTSKTKSGRFRVERAVHEGDYAGSGELSWTTSAEIKPV